MGLTSTAGLTAGVLRAGGGRRSNGWPFLLLVITACYGYQTSTAFTVSSPVAQPGAATLVFIFFGVGIARAWALFGLPGGALLDLLTACGSGSGSPGGASPGPAQAPDRRPRAGP